MNNQLEKLKIALQLKDSSQDELLSLYLADATDFLKLRLSIDGGELPFSMEAVVRAVAVKKFNRFKNEGMSSYSQEGESITFNSNDFADFEPEIEQYKKDHAGINRGRWINPYAIRH